MFRRGAVKVDSHYIVILFSIAMLDRITFIIFLASTISVANMFVQTQNALKNKRVLVFTRNGKGYVHENIPSGIAALQKLGKDNSFKVDTTTNPVYFSDDSLKKYDAI